VEKDSSPRTTTLLGWASLWKDSNDCKIIFAWEWLHNITYKSFNTFDGLHGLNRFGSFYRQVETARSLGVQLTRVDLNQLHEFDLGNLWQLLVERLLLHLYDLLRKKTLVHLLQGFEFCQQWEDVDIVKLVLFVLRYVAIRTD